jgi:hypothetical protein
MLHLCSYPPHRVNRAWMEACSPPMLHTSNLKGYKVIDVDTLNLPCCLHSLTVHILYSFILFQPQLGVQCCLYAPRES